MEDFSSMTDEALVLATRAGEEEAASVLLKRYKPVVHARAISFYLCGGDREDLLQEGMIGCYKAVLGFDPSRHVSFSAFADLCIRRQIYSAVKLAGRKKHEPLNTSVSLDTPVKEDGQGDTLAELLGDSGAADPEQMLLMRERTEEIAEAIRTSLSPLEKKVFALYLARLSYQDMAQELDIPEKSVDNAIQRVKKKLAGKIG